MPKWARGAAHRSRGTGASDRRGGRRDPAAGASTKDGGHRGRADPQATHTALTSWLMTPRGSPASPCSHSKGCALRPAAATTRSNKRSGPSSATDSGRSGFCGVAATNWNTPHLPSDAATSEEAGQAAETAQRLIAAAGKLLPQLSFFSQDQELRDHHRKPRHGIVPARSQPSPTRPPP